MRNLEELFYETNAKVTSKTNYCNEEQEKLLLEDLDKRAEDLIFDLKKYSLSDKIAGNIKDKIFELKDMLSKMNSGHAEKMVKESIQTLKSSIPELEVVLGQNEEQEQERSNQFSQIKNGIKRNSEEVKEEKDYMYIENCVKSSYNDIQRNITSYIEANGVIALELDVRSIEDIRKIVSDSYKECMQSMTKRHNVHIDSITQVIKDEVSDFQQNMEDMINKKSRDEHYKSNAEQFLDFDNVQPAENTPFQLSKEDLNKFKEGESRVIANTQKKPEEKRPLSNEEQFL